MNITFHGHGAFPDLNEAPPDDVWRIIFRDLPSWRTSLTPVVLHSGKTLVITANDLSEAFVGKRWIKCLSRNGMVGRLSKRLAVWRWSWGGGTPCAPFNSQDADVILHFWRTCYRSGGRTLSISCECGCSRSRSVAEVLQWCGSQDDLTLPPKTVNQIVRLILLRAYSYEGKTL